MSALSSHCHQVTINGVTLFLPDSIRFCTCLVYSFHAPRGAFHRLTRREAAFMFDGCAMFANHSSEERSGAVPFCAGAAAGYRLPPLCTRRGVSQSGGGGRQ